MEEECKQENSLAPAKESTQFRFVPRTLQLVLCCTAKNEICCTGSKMQLHQNQTNRKKFVVVPQCRCFCFRNLKLTWFLTIILYFLFQHEKKTLFQLFAYIAVTFPHLDTLINHLCRLSIFSTLFVFLSLFSLNFSFRFTESKNSGTFGKTSRYFSRNSTFRKVGSDKNSRHFL